MNNVGILYDKYLYVLNRYNLLECLLESNLSCKIYAIDSLSYVSRTNVLKRDNRFLRIVI